jgi:predicted MFS family arabinose efflux permease
VVAFVALSVAFVFIEMRTVEPIIPMRLFRNPIFSVGNTFGFLAGVAMFGGIIFLPLYFQGVMGMSPTRSGLAMLPMILGLLITSMGSGQLITKTGRYKIFPIIGSAVLIPALVLLGRLGVDTPYWQVAFDAFLFGAGLGFSMQTITTAVQNAVNYRDIGTATSSTTFFRQIGAAIGAAIFGAVFSSRLAQHLAEQLAGAPGGAPSGGAPIDANNIQAIQRLGEPVKHIVLTAFAGSLDDVFLACIPAIVVALIVAFFLKEVPLRTGAAPEGASEAATPMG